MRAIVVFALLAVVALQTRADFASLYKVKLNKVLNQAEKTVEELNGFKKMYHDNLQKTMTKIRAESETSINRASKATLEELEEVFQFGASDENPEVHSCYVKARASVAEGVAEAYKKFELCQNDNYLNVNLTLRNADELTQGGVVTMRSIEGVMDSCSVVPAADSEKEETRAKRAPRSVVTCYLNEINRAQASVQRFVHTANCLADSVHYDIPELELNVRPCNMRVVEEFRQLLPAIVDAGNACMEQNLLAEALE